MPVETTYTALREQLSGFLDRVTDDREVVIVRRRNGRDVAMLPVDELSSMVETLYLLRSSKNAERLFNSFRELEEDGGQTMTVAELRASLSVDQVSNLDKAS